MHRTDFSSETSEALKEKRKGLKANPQHANTQKEKRKKDFTSETREKCCYQRNAAEITQEN